LHISLLYYFNKFDKRLTAGVTGGRGIWREKAKGRIPLLGLNPLGRGNAPARPRARNVGWFLAIKNVFSLQN
jgi:hypothetical protein